MAMPLNQQFQELFSQMSPEAQQTMLHQLFASVNGVNDAANNTGRMLPNDPVSPQNGDNNPKQPPPTPVVKKAKKPLTDEEKKVKEELKQAIEIFDLICRHYNAGTTNQGLAKNAALDALATLWNIHGESVAARNAAVIAAIPDHHAFLEVVFNARPRMTPARGFSDKTQLGEINIANRKKLQTWLNELGVSNSAQNIALDQRLEDEARAKQQASKAAKTERDKARGDRKKEANAEKKRVQDAETRHKLVNLDLVQLVNENHGVLPSQREFARLLSGLLDEDFEEYWTQIWPTMRKANKKKGAAPAEDAAAAEDAAPAEDAAAAEDAAPAEDDALEPAPKRRALGPAAPAEDAVNAMTN